MLTCLQLKKHFGGVKAVDGCSFEVQEETITALIGPNGAGKSTVFNLISGILKEDAGKILFKAGKQVSPVRNLKISNGVSSKQISNEELIDITKAKPETISNLGISRLFQQSKLFNNLTVRENLLLALDNEDTKFWKNLLGRNKIPREKVKRIREMLNLVNMQNFENTLARDLSYGQKRLIELMRTVLNPHTFLMLDEPVAGVNPKLRKEIAKILLKLKEEGETILLIEHDMNFTLSLADIVIVMEKGKVIAEGSPEEIRKNPRVLEAYLGE